MCIAALLPGSAFSFSWQKKFVAQCQEVGSPAHLQASNAVLADLNLVFFLVPSSTEGPAEYLDPGTCSKRA